MEDKKKLLRDAIDHKPVRVPTMYRGEPPVNKRLADYFGLGDVESQWEELTRLIGADNYSDGETLGGFTTYFPKYIGPDFGTLFEINRFYIWGIKPVEIEAGGNRDIVFSKNPPLADKDELDDVRNYPYPRLEWFDFGVYKNNSEQVAYSSEDEQEDIRLEDLKPSDKYFLNTSCLNSIFMTSIYMRGMDNMLMDLVTNQEYAQALIGNIGEFMVAFCKRNLESIGKKIDLYGIWDDFASQEGLMLSPELWRKYYKPWDEKIIEIAKKYDLLVCFHICGNCRAVLPDLIEMGVDILDPVQTSARDMELDGLKKEYGKDLCFHGGLDIQGFLPRAAPSQVREKVVSIKDMFDGQGGLILGPSHYITNDTPTENILAIYR
ncbi:MAG: uroporphyrinogen decarboxylase family protein [Actinomycetota bacterium]